jgi:uncharacterized coiled-coil protein SlyX
MTEVNRLRSDVKYVCQQQKRTENRLLGAESTNDVLSNRIGIASKTESTVKRQVEQIRVLSGAVAEVASLQEQNQKLTVEKTRLERTVEVQDSAIGSLLASVGAQGAEVERLKPLEDTVTIQEEAIEDLTVMIQEERALVQGAKDAIGRMVKQKAELVAIVEASTETSARIVQQNLDVSAESRTTLAQFFEMREKLRVSEEQLEKVNAELKHKSEQLGMLSPLLGTPSEMKQDNINQAKEIVKLKDQCKRALALASKFKERLEGSRGGDQNSPEPGVSPKTTPSLDEEFADCERQAEKEAAPLIAQMTAMVQQAVEV